MELSKGSDCLMKAFCTPYPRGAADKMLLSYNFPYNSFYSISLKDSHPYLPRRICHYISAIKRVYGNEWVELSSIASENGVPVIKKHLVLERQNVTLQSLCHQTVDECAFYSYFIVEVSPCVEVIPQS